MRRFGAATRFDQAFWRSVAGESLIWTETPRDPSVSCRARFGPQSVRIGRRCADGKPATSAPRANALARTGWDRLPTVSPPPGLQTYQRLLNRVPSSFSPRLSSSSLALTLHFVLIIPSLRPAQFDHPMADHQDVYSSSSPSSQYRQYRPQDHQQSYPMSSPNVYPPSAHSSPDPSAPHSPPKSDHVHQQQQQPQQQPQPQPVQKSDSKPQATFLTKLYALLERPENHHMIRWDPAGEHIIVERPEQLALHVLPSIYRQSRFASFSRQLNIYGFMRKVNLRNVDPAIDDPDASTWSHPTLNRHSSPEVVANFKRRVPPRLPKPRKRAEMDPHSSIPPPRSANGLGGVPLTVPSNMGLTASPKGGRARGFSAPGPYNTLGQTNAWNNYGRGALPPLTVPSDPPMSSHGMSSHGMYNHSPHPLHPISPSEDAAGGFSNMPYTTSGRDVMPSQYTYGPEQSNWQFSPVSSGSSSGHSGSLSSLLNPSSSGYPPSRPTINTSYSSSLSSVSMQHSASSLSPDSRPATGYSSISSITYEEGNGHGYSHDYSRPGSGHPRPLTPTSSRPPSSKANYSTATGSLSIRRGRRHSQAVNPYPTPYEHMDQRPSTSPQPAGGDEHSMHRSRSMIQLPTVDPYSSNFASSQAGDFAYAVPMGGMDGGVDMEGGWNSRSVRPSTSASSLSAASQTSSSQAHTPPVTDGFGETDIHRFSPDFGFVPMHENLSQYAAKTGEVEGSGSTMLRGV
ncbi:hypothetical protein EW146_g8435 [Bondarzewia mesenterica]|uniref:HSF-type DNA-binding domain-containing protein n=1 Tax=Bondarzewia mesenterica TaxID=1095465 RepID=A0A4S4LJZ5_9AGAM|nr:hypothetical protein EW146_g8435 [Bondarzewia mesenterica]